MPQHEGSGFDPDLFVGGDVRTENCYGNIRAHFQVHECMSHVLSSVFASLHGHLHGLHQIHK